MEIEESILNISSRNYIDENGIIRSNSKRSNMVFKRMLEEEGSEREDESIILNNTSVENYSTLQILKGL